MKSLEAKENIIRSNQLEGFDFSLVNSTNDSKFVVYDELNISFRNRFKK